MEEASGGLGLVAEYRTQQTVVVGTLQYKLLVRLITIAQVN